MRQNLADNAVRTEEAGLKLILRLIDGCLLHGARYAVAGIANHGVDMSLFGDNVCHDLGDALLVVDIEHNRNNVFKSRALLANCAATTAGIDLIASLGQQAHSLGSDARRATGEENHLDFAGHYLMMSYFLNTF